MTSASRIVIGLESVLLKQLRIFVYGISATPSALNIVALMLSAAHADVGVVVRTFDLGSD